MGAFNTLSFNPSRCDACGLCVEACIESAQQRGEPAVPRLQILGKQGDGLAICRQCGDPECVKGCPAAALAKNPETGVVEWDAGLCVSCLICTVSCSFGGITHHPESGRMLKCDHCGGDPACARACPSDALNYLTLAGIYNDQHQREDLFVPGLSACQGCNSEMIMRHSLRRVGPDTVLATPPGCIPGMGSVGYNGLTGTKVPVFHPLLTNTASMLAGLKRHYNRIGRKVTAMALAGDGGAGDVGFQSLSGAAERNEPMLFVCVDNEGYMNTGMQASGSTSYGSWTSTTPVGERMQGKSSEQKILPLIMMTHNCEYVATASMAYPEDFHAKLQRAHEASERGMAYLHIYSPCPSGWRFPSSKTIEVCRKSVETNFAPLWEFHKGGQLVFTRPVKDPLPVERYLELSGKYRHLDSDQLQQIQAQVRQRIAMLQRFARPTAGL